MKQINIKNILLKRALNVSLLSTSLFAGLLLLIEKTFFIEITLIFFVISFLITYSIMNYKKLLTLEKSLAFSALGGLFFVFIAIFLGNNIGLLSSMDFPNLKVGVDNIQIYIIYLSLLFTANYWISLKLNKVI